MSQPRIEMNAVILPNGKVLAVGGSVNDEDTSTKSLNADLYDPATNTISSAGANAYARLYHSVALLLRDGLAGRQQSYTRQLRVAYRDLPACLSVPVGRKPGYAPLDHECAWQRQLRQSIYGAPPDAANISSVVLIRPGTVTHAFGMDQRMVGMSFTAGAGALTVTAPPNGNTAPPGYYMLFLLNSQGVPSIANFVQLGSSSPPTVSAIAPTSGSANGVTITGTGFLAGATVSLGGTAAAGVTVVSSTSITATTPAHAAGSVDVVVTNSDAQSGTLTQGFTYTASNSAPTVTSIAPNTGPPGGGTGVTITGTNFFAGAAVSLGGTAATAVTVVSSTSITATTPANAVGAATVVVTNSDGQSGTLANGYTYTSTNPAPKVTSITPNTGPAGGGTGVTITGTNFLAGATVSFDGTTATSVTVVNSTLITATTPVHIAEGGVVPVVVTNTDSRSGTLTNGYTYTSTNPGSPGLGLGVASGSSGSATVAAGQTVSYTLSIGGAGMSGTASLSCTGAPIGASCSVPVSEPFSSTVPATFSVSVTTTSRTLAALHPPVSMPVALLWAIAALGMVVRPAIGAPKWSVRRYLRLAPLTLLLFVVSCGGGGSPGGQQPNPNGTPAGTYTLTVKANSGSTTEATSLTLTVQ